MYGYQRVKLIVKSNPDYKMIKMPPLNNFKMVLTGRQPSDSTIDILLESTQTTETEIRDDLIQQLKNLKLYLNLYSDNMVDAIQHDSFVTDYHDQKDFEKILQNSLDELTDIKLQSYLSKRTTQQHLLLQTALDELENNNLFNAFPKLVNWLDDNDHKGASRFCSIRDSCDHGTLDRNRAIKRVNEAFPDKFEFEDDTLKRDSIKNTQSLQQYLPEVLIHIKKVFKQKYVS